MLKIVAGLGNPGRKYSGTRHNIGFEVVEEFARRFSADRWKSRFKAETTEVLVGSERVLLLAPQTMMNLSGQSIRSAVDFFGVPVSDVLVICDDLNLDPGRLRLKGSGSAGGQNGLKNIIAQLGTMDFPRLRVGIGRPPEGADVVNYVLQTFAKSERNCMSDAVMRACSATEAWIQNGLVAAMNIYNRAESTEQ